MSLEQAERQYEEHIAQALAEQSPSVTDPPLLGVMENTGESDDEEQTSQVELRQGMLLHMARAEVESVRSSLSRSSVFDGTTLQAQITRHSQRLSWLMEGDQQRLSQRWSRILHSGLGIDAETSNPGYFTQPTLRTSAIVGKPRATLGSVPTLRREAQYLCFQAWFLEQPPNIQTEILRTLREDMLSSQHLKDQVRLSNVVIPSRNQRSRRLNNTSIRSAKATETYSAQIDKASDDVRVQNIISLIEAQVAAYHQQLSPEDLGLGINLTFHGISNLTSITVNALRHVCIERLNLGLNNLKMLPGNLSLCEHLQYLDLSRNNFVTIPDPILHLPSLEGLNMHRNSLSYIPSTISGMKKLKTLCIAGNKIQGIPFAI